MTRLRVSVVIPVHNGMPHVKETIESVRRQTRAPDEVIILENGSTDGTREWLESVDLGPFRVLFQPELVPAGQNWTDAVGHSSGDLVKLLCADDLIAPDAIEVQAAQLESTPGAVIAAAQRTIIEDDGKVAVARRGLFSLRQVTEGRAAVKRCAQVGGNLLGEPSAVMFRGKDLRACLPWDGSLGYVIDLDMYARVLQRGQVVVTRRSLASFRMAANSWSANLVAVQAEQVNAFVDRIDTNGWADLNRFDRLVSRAAVAAQTTARRAVYALTRLRGGR